MIPLVSFMQLCFHITKRGPFKMVAKGTCLLVQWLRIHLAMQGDKGSIPDRGTKIPHATEQLNPQAATTEPTHSTVCALQQDCLCTTTKGPHDATKTRCSQINKWTIFLMAATFLNHWLICICKLHLKMQQKVSYWLSFQGKVRFGSYLWNPAHMGL